MKNSTKRRFALFGLLACSGLSLASSVHSAPIILRPLKAVDISCRPALYFGNGVLGETPLTSPYATPDKTIVLTPADAFAQEDGLYSFNVMYIVYGSTAKKAVAAGSFTDRIYIRRKLLSQHQVQFTDEDKEAANAKIHTVITQIKLPLGENRIWLSLDADKAIKESDEDNNLHAFTVVVTTKP